MINSIHNFIGLWLHFFSAQQLKIQDHKDTLSFLKNTCSSVSVVTENSREKRSEAFSFAVGFTLLFTVLSLVTAKIDILMFVPHYFEIHTNNAETAVIICFRQLRHLALKQTCIPLDSFTVHYETQKKRSLFSEYSNNLKHNMIFALMVDFLLLKTLVFFSYLCNVMAQSRFA